MSFLRSFPALLARAPLPSGHAWLLVVLAALQSVGGGSASAAPPSLGSRAAPAPGPSPTPSPSAGAASAAEHGKRCSSPVTLGMFEKPSGACSVDVSVAGRTGTLHHPCSGSGPAEATFGLFTFTGTMKNFLLDVRLPSSSRRSRGCDWQTTQALRGNWKERSLALEHLETAKAGQSGCSNPCQARASATVTEDPPVDAAADEPAPLWAPKDADARDRVNVPLKDSPARGLAAAPLTVVTFVDYQCPSSRKLQALMAELEKRNPSKLRWVMKQSPLSFHARAWAAARAAVAAKRQGKFWEMHARLFQDPRALSDAQLEQHARALGLDVRRWRQDLQSKEVIDEIQRDQLDAARLSVTATPTSFVNGYRVLPGQPLDVWSGILEAEQERAAAQR